MKKIILLFIIIQISNHFAEAQWVMQNSGTSSFLRDVEFLNRNTGWAVGDGGVILKTTNGGINWLNITNPAVGKPLFSIHLVDSNICYVVGWFETIIKSTDGGTSWIVIRNNEWGFGSSYDAVFFIDENTGWIAGTGQKILRTTNGGDSITTDYLFAGNLHDMYFKDALTGIVTGSGTDMFKTTNGGLSWNNIVMPIGFRIPDFYKITFVNDLTGWVAGSDRRIFKTTSFGDTWSYIDSIAVNPQMRCAEFIDKNTGFVGGEQGYLFKSTDGGENFVRENSGNFPPALIMSMCFYNDSIGWAVGGGGKIMKTTNGGQTMVYVISQKQELPNEFSLSQNFPNPFNSKTKVNYKIGKEAFIQIKIFDLSGKEIITLINKKQNKGNYEIDFDASELSSGIYFYSLYINNTGMDKKKFVLLK